LGSKVGFDATNKWPGKPTGMGQNYHNVARSDQKVDEMWDKCFNAMETGGIACCFVTQLT